MFVKIVENVNLMLIRKCTNEYNVLFVDVYRVLCTQPPLPPTPFQPHQKSPSFPVSVSSCLYDHIYRAAHTEARSSLCFRFEHTYVYLFGESIYPICWVQKLSGNPTWQSFFGALKYLVGEVGDLGGRGTKVDLIYVGF